MAHLKNSQCARKRKKEKFSNVVLKWKQIWSISYHYCKLSRYSVHNMKMSGVHT